MKLCLENAEAIYYQIKESKHLTDEIRIIIGEEPLHKENDNNNLDDDDDDDDGECLTPIVSKALDDDQKLDELCEISMHYSLL